MVRTIRSAGIVAGLLVNLLLMICGCQNERAGDAAAPVEPPTATAVAEQPQASAPVEGAPPAAPETPKAQAVEPVPQESATLKAGSRESGPVVNLTLKFSPGRRAGYRILMAEERGVDWEGAGESKPAGFKGGRTGNRIEMVFEQDVQSVDPNGDATARITIKELKYLGRVRDNIVLDFDGAKQENLDTPLAALIGQSYQVRLSPDGRVKVVDVRQARSLVEGGTPMHRTAQKLLSDDEIRQRHSIEPLTALKDNQIRAGYQWSDVKPFSFGLMGAKSYERVYTLAEVAQTDEGPVAVVEMKGIPSAPMAEQLRQQQASVLSGLFDNIEEYKGRLELDLSGGQVRRYGEELNIQWAAADPAAVQGDVSVSVLKMTTTRTHRLEQID